jgi:hypothetical protein
MTIRSELRGRPHLPDGELIELCLPPSVDLVVLARFTAATVAARANFDVDEIEDLRLAVDELCVSFGPIERHGSLRLVFERKQSLVRITCSVESPTFGVNGTSSAGSNGASLQRVDELSRQLLDALVDDHGRDDLHGRPCAWLEKRGGVMVR